MKPSKPHHVSRFTFQPSDTEVLALTTLALAYSNLLPWWATKRGLNPESMFRRVNTGLVVLMLTYAARRSGGLERVGLRLPGLGKSLQGGTLIGLALSIPPLIFFYRPILLDTPLEYGPIHGMSRRELLQDLFVGVPVKIALLEELLFRGLIFSALRRNHSPALSLAGASAAFAGWHFSVTYTTAAQTNLATAARLPSFLKPFVQPLAVLGGMLSTGLAGVAFGLVRQRTNNLAGSIVAHWLVDGIMIYALWRGRPDQTPV
ncbi:MAG: protease family protein [Chloroflexia bacterium]|jgi:membrane protease YdiL (CAAX protease family)|nr:protease family protein [Chloroflexia bacterium]